MDGLEGGGEDGFEGPVGVGAAARGAPVGDAPRDLAHDFDGIAVEVVEPDVAADGAAERGRDAGVGYRRGGLSFVTEPVTAGDAGGR